MLRGLYPGFRDWTEDQDWGSQRERAYEGIKIGFVRLNNNFYRQDNVQISFLCVDPVDKVLDFPDYYFAGNYIRNFIDE